MKIAQIVDKFLPITESWIYSQIKGLEKLGLESEIFCHRIINTDSYGHKIIYSYKDLSSWKINYYRSMGKLTKKDGATQYWNRKIKNKKFDLVHSHFGWAAQKGIDLAIKNNIPHIVTFYGSDITRDPFDKNNLEYQKKLPLILDKSKKIICTSHFIKKKIISLGGDPQKTFVWRPGILPPKSISTYDKKDDRNIKLNYITIGRFHECKGHVFLIKAIPEVIRHNDNFKLKIIGGGKLKNTYEKLISRLGLQEYISLHDHMPYQYVIQQIAQSDVIIHPSIRIQNGSEESLGMVLAEAALFGIPAIASNIGGIPEIVVNNKTGLLAEEKNPADLAKKIIFMLQNKHKITEFGKNAKYFAQENFNQAIQIEKLHKLSAN